MRRVPAARPRAGRGDRGPLGQLDLAEIRARIEAADLDALIEDEELDDLELLDPDQAPAVIRAGLGGLIAFYAGVAQQGLGLVIRTT